MEQAPPPAAAEAAAAPADCTLCGEATEVPAEQPGAQLCPRCAWQQQQRDCCSG
ncbi:hypothetical protein [Streptacidiphilus albus]|uniref:hypothetical protein n=1 Tax=Streptacidiphilus albus TaxID=105425 RepID=UPI000AC0F62C|nr:hypothetical protein [Streptacidiphilus albus]